MMHKLEHKVNNSITGNNLLDITRKLIVGLSGGADSVAMLSVLTSLGYKCIAAHCNFSLRGDEADRDQEHAKQIASITGAEWQCIKFDTRSYMATKGISAEMACRELRYEWFEKLMRQHNAQAIAVAHHRDDNIETLLLNLLRGSGVHGLRGMLPRNGYVIRPMLDCTREEIIAYLNERHLSFVTDSSNAINDVKRNRLRNIVIPTIRQYFPDAMHTISHSIDILRQNEAIVNEMTESIRKKYVHNDTLCLSELIDGHSDTVHALLFELLSPAGFNASQILDMIKSCQTGCSGKIFNTATHNALLDRGHLIVQLNRPTETDVEIAIDFTADANYPISLNVEKISANNFAPQRDPNVIYFDADRVTSDQRWALRHWHEGDRILPFGMKGTRKLSDIFSDAKLSAHDKDRVWLLTCDDAIVWVLGLRASRLFAVTQDTKSIIKITYSPSL